MKFNKTMGKLFSVVALALGLFLVMESNAQASELEFVDLTEQLSFSEYTELNQAIMEAETAVNPLEPPFQSSTEIQPFCVSGAPVSTFRLTTGLRSHLTSNGSILGPVFQQGWIVTSSSGIQNGRRQIRHQASNSLGWVSNNVLTPISC